MVAKHAAVAGIFLMALASSPAWADSICSGTMTGSVLQPLPRPTTVSVVQPVSDDANPAIAQQFLSGIQAGGFTVVAAGQGNTQLDLTSTVSAGPGASSNVFKGFGWMTGMQMPNGGGSALAGSSVSLSIEATDTTAQALAWIGTVQCTVGTTDPNALSAHLGELVARVLGKSVQQRNF